METFTIVSAILFWIIFLFGVSYFFISKNEVLKYIILMPGLRKAVKQFIEAYKENPKDIKLDVIINLVVAIIRRLTLPGVLFFLLGGILSTIPIWLLYRQNMLIASQDEKLEQQNDLFKNQNELIQLQAMLAKTQNELFEGQNKRIDTQLGLMELQNSLGESQNYLIQRQVELIDRQNSLLDTQNQNITLQNNLLETNRRSSLVSILGNIFDRINYELYDQSNSEKQLSGAVIGRLVALSNSLQPYKMFDEGKLKPVAYSPERGQIIIVLSKLNANRNTLDEIFSKINLHSAYLPNVNLDSGYLAGADLTSLFAENANFKSSNLKYSNLSKSWLLKANFVDADLIGSNFLGAFLQDAIFVEAKLDSASFVQAILSGTNLSAAKMNGSNLSFATANGAKFLGTGLSNSNLTSAKFIFSNCMYSNFSNSILNNTLFWGTDLREASFENCDLRTCTFRESIFSHAQVFEASFLKPEFVKYNGLTKTFNKKYIPEKILKDYSPLFDIQKVLEKSFFDKEYLESLSDEYNELIHGLEYDILESLLVSNMLNGYFGFSPFNFLVVRETFIDLGTMDEFNYPEKSRILPDTIKGSFISVGLHNINLKNAKVGSKNWFDELKLLKVVGVEEIEKRYFIDPKTNYDEFGIYYLIKIK